MLEVTTRLLQRNGYRVLQAASGEAALTLAAQNDFDLLLTDSVMPKMSGSVLTERLKVARPDLAVLFMSGYSKGVLSPQRLIDEEVALIQKPFTERDLLMSVSAVLRLP
jgi:CheY-like chemotaxis protein